MSTQEALASEALVDGLKHTLSSGVCQWHRFYTRCCATIHGDILACDYGAHVHTFAPGMFEQRELWVMMMIAGKSLWALGSDRTNNRIVGLELYRLWEDGRLRGPQELSSNRHDVGDVDLTPRELKNKTARDRAVEASQYARRHLKTDDPRLAWFAEASRVARVKLDRDQIMSTIHQDGSFWVDRGVPSLDDLRRWVRMQESDIIDELGSLDGAEQGYGGGLDVVKRYASWYYTEYWRGLVLD